MEHSDRPSSPLGGFDAEAVLGLSSPASAGLSCAVSKLDFLKSTSASLEYSPSEGGWEFADPCPPRGLILFRNAVSQAGYIFDILSVSPRAFKARDISAIFLSRNVASVGKSCFSKCPALQFVAFERDSHLREMGTRAFSACRLLGSIAIPSLVGLLRSRCFRFCWSLGSAIFEPPSNLATIEERAFYWCTWLRSIAIPSLVGLLRSGSFRCCRSLGSAIFERPSNVATIEENAFFWCSWLTHFSIPASVTAIGDSAFTSSGISPIEIEEGSVSFRVLNDLLVDFEVRSLIWVIGSPESILIPSSIQELRPCCCAWKELRAVEFERDSSLRSIGRLAFAGCRSLESILIPSSVEVLHEGCFQSCDGLRKVTFGRESKLRLIERMAFQGCQSLSLIGVPASVEILHCSESDSEEVRVECV
jgi:hypothetical protein